MASRRIWKSPAVTALVVAIVVMTVRELLQGSANRSQNALVVAAALLLWIVIKGWRGDRVGLMAVALFIANPHMRGWNWLEAAITVAVAAALALMLDVAAIRLASFQKRRSTDRLLLTRPLITRNATLLVIVAVLIELFALG